MNRLPQLMDEYARNLEGFIKGYELPTHWFVRPDHVALKCSDGQHYDTTLKQASNIADKIYESDVNNRRIATIFLNNPIALGSLGSVGLLEIMEPRPERVGNDLVGLDHAEFVVPRLREVAGHLRGDETSFVRERNDGHEWITVVLPVGRQEVKFTERSLEEVINAEIASGLARSL